MNLYEFEGKSLFQKHEISVPKGITVKKDELIKWSIFPCVVKAQIQSGKRGKNGGVKMIDSEAELQVAVEQLFDTQINNEDVLYVRIEEKLPITEELYLSFTYNASLQKAVMLVSKSGGVDVEESDEPMQEYEVDPLKGFETEYAAEAIKKAGIENEQIIIIAQQLYTMFTQEDARLAEINPLAILEDGRIVALDAKVILDDDAGFRHQDEEVWSGTTERTTMGRRFTERELEVTKIDKGEFYYRGTAGKYIEMDGDIACLFSGGGASISMMDALEHAGGAPANYTEYSGNPPREKVHALAKIVLSKQGLKGIWIAGGVANFTNVKETMAGIADALRELKPQIPIIIRRAGPFEAEGKQLMLELAEEIGLNLQWYGRETSMTDTAKLLMDEIAQ